MAFMRERLQLQRKAIGKTLENVATIVGVSRQTIQRYETGEIKRIDTFTVEKLAKALECSPAYLMGWTDNPIIQPPVDLSKLHAPTRIVLPDSDDVINIADLSEEQQKIIKDMIKVFKEGK